MRKFIACAIGMSLLYLNVFAQEPVEKCGTTVDLKKMRTQEPERYHRFMEVERFTQSYIKAQKEKKGIHSERVVNPEGLIIIPVVVHVLHRGEAEGTGLNVSMARIQEQIDILNKDFRRLNADRVNTPTFFVPRAADFNIEFRLACFDPNGNPTNGVTRTYAGKASFTLLANEVATGVKLRSEGGADPWPASHYLNIWVCNIDAYGYGTLPDDYSIKPQYDGIVLQTGVFGITNAHPAGLGRTATHEVGHWLNLIHIWGDKACGDDLVEDTPTQFWKSENKCPSFPTMTSCTNPADQSKMFMNYMDYTDDRCVNLFTNGQRARARAMFATVNGVAGPRVGQLNGFFGFAGQPTTINCKGKITVSPLCLPVTWTVTGPVTIKSGNGTSQLELEATGNGTAHLTVTSGNYTAETDIQVQLASNVSPSLKLILPFDADCNIKATATAANAVCYEWTTNSGILANGSTFLSCAGDQVDITRDYGNEGKLAVRAQLTNGCYTDYAYHAEVRPCIPWGDFRVVYFSEPDWRCAAMSAMIESSDNDAIEYEWFTSSSNGMVYLTSTYLPEMRGGVCTCGEWVTLYVRKKIWGGVSTLMEVGTFYQFCSGLTANSPVTLAPNPASTSVKISVTENIKSGAIQLTGIYQVKVFDKIGTVLKVQQYGKGLQDVTLDVSGLKTDIYVLEISDGKNVVRQHLSVKR